MAGQVTVYPVSATMSASGAITMEILPGKLHRCTTLGLRPKNKDASAVLADIEDRIRRNAPCRLGDMSWPGGEGTPWFYEYRERIPGHVRAQPDPDGAVLRYHETLAGID